MVNKYVGAGKFIFGTGKKIIQNYLVKVKLLAQKLLNLLKPIHKLQTQYIK